MRSLRNQASLDGSVSLISHGGKLGSRLPPYLPPLQAVFGTEPVPFTDGLLIVAIGAVFFTLVETEKQMRLALGKPRAIG